MKFCVLLVILLFIVGCSKPPFEVRQFHLRGEQTLSTPVSMLKGEARYRFDQNLTAAARKQKRGQYFAFSWKEKIVSSNANSLELLFQYRQAATGRATQQKRISLPVNGKKKVETAVIGEEYLKKGRVLSWRASLIQDGKEIASEQSFLWD